MTAVIAVCVRVVELSPVGMSRNTNPDCAHPVQNTPARAGCGQAEAAGRGGVFRAMTARSHAVPTRAHPPLRPDISHLDLQQLLMVGGVHLLQGLLKLMVPVQEGFPQLRRQVEICKHRAAASTQVSQNNALRPAEDV